MKFNRLLLKRRVCSYRLDFSAVFAIFVTWYVTLQSKPTRAVTALPAQRQSSGWRHQPPPPPRGRYARAAETAAVAAAAGCPRRRRRPAPPCAHMCVCAQMCARVHANVGACAHALARGCGACSGKPAQWSGACGLGCDGVCVCTHMLLGALIRALPGTARKYWRDERACAE